MTNKYVLLAGGASLVLILGFALRGRPEATKPVAHLADGAEPGRVFAVGRVEGATPEIDLRPQVAGPITKVLVEEGQHVEQHQVLLQIDERRQLHALTLASADLDLAQGQLELLLNGARPEERAEAEALHRAKLAELEQSRLTWQRIKPLRQANAVSQQEADKQHSRLNSLTAEVEATRARLQRVQARARADEVKIAKARVAAAKSLLDLASFELEQTRVRSPVRGQVLKITPEVGELAGPSSIEPAIIVSGIGTFHVRAFVEEMDAPRVRIGMVAEIAADGLPGQKLKGRVVRLSPRMGRKTIWSDEPTERHDTKTREVWIELEEAIDIVIGLRVDVFIDLRTPQRVTNNSVTADARY